MSGGGIAIVFSPGKIETRGDDKIMPVSLEIDKFRPKIFFNFSFMYWSAVGILRRHNAFPSLKATRHRSNYLRRKMRDERKTLNSFYIF